MSNYVSHGKFPDRTERATSRLGTCTHCGAPVFRWPLAWSIERFCEDSSLSRAYIYQQIASKKLEIRKAGSRSLVLFDVGWSFLQRLPAFSPESSGRSRPIRPP